MRRVYLDMISNNRGTDDAYYYLVFNEETAELFVEYSWHNWSPRGIDEGSENITLAELKRRKPSVYQKAVNLITAQFPVKEEGKLSYPLESKNNP